MFIMTDLYDAGRIYKVINPEDCPLIGGDGANHMKSLSGSLMTTMNGSTDSK